jgi:hypothetical protein
MKWEERKEEDKGIEEMKMINGETGELFYYKGNGGRKRR